MIIEKGGQMFCTLISPFCIFIEKDVTHFVLFYLKSPG